MGGKEPGAEREPGQARRRGCEVWPRRSRPVERVRLAWGRGLGGGAEASARRSV